MRRWETNLWRVFDFRGIPQILVSQQEQEAPTTLELPCLLAIYLFYTASQSAKYNASTTCTIPSKPLNNAVLSVHMGTDILRSRAAQLKCFSSVIERIITKVHKVCTKVTVLWNCTKTRGSISCQSSLYVALKAELRYCSGNNKTILYDLGFYNT